MRWIDEAYADELEAGDHLVTLEAAEGMAAEVRAVVDLVSAVGALVSASTAFHSCWEVDAHGSECPDVDGIEVRARIEDALQRLGVEV